MIKTSRLGFIAWACAAAGSLYSTAADAATLQRHVFDPAVYPEALCNDGTPAVFYYEPGTESDKWLVYLQGGGGCGNPGSCESRLLDTPDRMGSGCLGPAQCNDGSGGPLAGVSDTLSTIDEDFDGLFDSSTSDLGAWNRIYVEYCSSDGWSGTGGTMPGNTFGFQNIDGGTDLEFHGHQIVEAVFDELEALPTHSPNDPDTTILFAGGSAGANGAMRNLDYVADRYPNADVRGLFDSLYHGTIVPDGAVCSSALDVLQIQDLGSSGLLDRYAYFGGPTGAFADESCMQNALDPALCLLPDQIVGLDEISTPYVVYQSFHDFNSRTGTSVGNALDVMGLAKTTTNRNQCVEDTVIDFFDITQTHAAFEGGFYHCQQKHVVAPNTHSVDNEVDDETMIDMIEHWFDGSGRLWYVDDSCL